MEQLLNTTKTKELITDFRRNKPTLFISGGCMERAQAFLDIHIEDAYRPLIRHSKQILKLVKTWPEGAISALQDCFECAYWDMFRETATNSDTTDLEEYTSSVTSYISTCIDDVTISKSITTHSNQKWMTAKVHALLKSSDSAFRAGDKDALSTA
ncbi:hypothetical protein QTP86_004833 [Hemibagrus guttatus]|nr:hypothetical protein QTP86_004833 [Hemibagrus guttatus]